MKLPHIAKYILSITILALIFLAGGFVLFKNYFVTSCFFNYYLSNLILFVSVNVLFHFLLTRAIDQKPKKFFFLYLLFTTVKLILYTGFIIIILFVISQGKICFLISFIVLYLAFTIHEIIYILNYSKNKKV
jgi:hypothetical protein